MIVAIKWNRGISQLTSRVALATTKQRPRQGIEVALDTKKKNQQQLAEQGFHFSGWSRNQ